MHFFGQTTFFIFFAAVTRTRAISHTHFLVTYNNRDSNMVDNSMVGSNMADSNMVDNYQKASLDANNQDN